MLCSEFWFLCPCSLLDSFDMVPGHLTEDLHLYSLSDLSATKKGELVPRLTELLKAGSLHVEKCMVRPPSPASCMAPYHQEHPWEHLAAKITDGEAFDVQDSHQITDSMLTVPACPTEFLLSHVWDVCFSILAPPPPLTHVDSVLLCSMLRKGCPACLEQGTMSSCPALLYLLPCLPGR